MSYEELYYELLEKVDRAYDKWCLTKEEADWGQYHIAQLNFDRFCVAVLEKLMEENSDVLARLKTI